MAESKLFHGSDFCGRVSLFGAPPGRQLVGSQWARVGVARMIYWLSNVSSSSSSSDEVAGGCQALPSWGLLVGVAMGVAGSIGINIGQNLQAAGIMKLEEQKAMAIAKGVEKAAADFKPHKSRQWMVGLIIFIAFSLINFAAFALAPASVLTPLESIQFVTNIFYNRFVNRVRITRDMYIGVTITVVGTILTVVFGPEGGSSCHSIATLEGYWRSWLWWAWMVLSLSIAVSAYVAERLLRRRLAAGDKRAPRTTLLLPLSFTLYSALAGGAQMIVHSKVLSELLALAFQGRMEVFTEPLLYGTIVLVVVCGCIWIVQLTRCLAMYNPLLILPLMVGCFILFGGVAGGIFFQEFEHLSEGFAGAWAWFAFIGGFLCVLGGLAMIATASEKLEHTINPPEAPIGALDPEDELTQSSESSESTSGDDARACKEGSAKDAPSLPQPIEPRRFNWLCPRLNAVADEKAELPITAGNGAPLGATVSSPRGRLVNAMVNASGSTIASGSSPGIIRRDASTPNHAHFATPGSGGYGSGHKCVRHPAIVRHPSMMMPAAHLQEIARRIHADSPLPPGASPWSPSASPWSPAFSNLASSGGSRYLSRVGTSPLPKPALRLSAPPTLGLTRFYSFFLPFSERLESMWTAGRSPGMLTPHGTGPGVPIPTPGLGGASSGGGARPMTPSPSTRLSAARPNSDGMPRPIRV